MSEPKTPAGRFAERVLVGTLESLARGIAKGVESVASDAKNALRNEAKKIDKLQKGVETWREQLGEIECDDSDITGDTGTFKRRKAT